MNNFEEHAKLIVKDGIVYPYAQYTHPLKQDDIQIIYDRFLRDPNVKLLVVFGSTVNLVCHSNSDLDLYVELQNSDTPPKIPDNVVSDVDLVYDIPETSSLYKSIDRDGIILIDRRE